MRKRNKEANETNIDPTAWMVTFGDLLMLLLTFFVMLLSMSSMDLKMLRTVFSIFQSVGGVLEMSDKGEIAPSPEVVSEGGTAATLKEGGSGALGGGSIERKVAILEDRVEQLAYQKKGEKITNLAMLEDFFLEDSGVGRDKMRRDLESILSITEDTRGVVITLEESILFDPGEAEIKPGTYSILRLIATVISAVSNEVLIMGHTDNQPTRNKHYRSNWELSLYRALNVHRYFVQEMSIPPERLGVGGYGDLRPKYPNITPENREKNRRVEIILRKT